jgi:hypothetical protein
MERDIQTVPVPVTNTEGDAERERGAEGGFDLDLLSILLSLLVSIVSSPSLVFISFLSSCTTRAVLVFSAGKWNIKLHRLGVGYVFIFMFVSLSSDADNC